MVTIKTLAECNIEEGVKAWNSGFEGYYFDASTTMDKFVNRIDSEGLSPDLSIVAFIDKVPVGIILNGVKEAGRKKLAWNGGTGIAIAYRNQGLGQALMKHTLDIYRREGVNMATLEAISKNKRAISLYEKLGYQVIDHLEYLELSGMLPDNPLPQHSRYPFVKGLPEQAGNLSFYKAEYPWQTHWERAQGGEAVFLLDEAGSKLGYAYFRRSFDNKGVHTSTVLYQCEANPSGPDPEKIVMELLQAVFGSFNDEVKRIIINLPKSSVTYPFANKIGFKPFASQVYMVKNIF